MKTKIRSLLQECLDALDVEDRGADDGDGHYDTWQSQEREDLVRRVKEALAELDAKSFP